MDKILEKLDGVPEHFHQFYEQAADGEHKGKYVLQDISSLKNALNYTKTERNEVKSKLKQLEGYSTLGKSPEEIRELLEKIENEQHESNKKKGDVDALLKQHQDKWGKEKETLAKDVDFWRGQYQNSHVNGNLASALAKLEATQEGLDLLPDRLKNRVQFQVEGNQVRTRIVNEDGTPMAGSGADGMATFEDLVGEARKKYPSLFKGTGGSGSGASNNGNGSGAGNSNLKRSKMTIPEKTAYLRDHGKAAYDALPY